MKHKIAAASPLALRADSSLHAQTASQNAASHAHSSVHPKENRYRNVLKRLQPL